MTTPDYELLSRYLDRELEPGERAALEARLAREPELDALLTRMRRLGGTIRSAYGAEPAGQVPERVTALLRQDDKVTPLPRRALSRAAWPVAMAASLVAAVALVLVSGQGGDSGATGDDPLVAHALDSEPSRADGWATLADGRQLRPVLTFPDRGGQWCREFLLREAEQDWRGVACREDGAWSTQVLARSAFLAAGSSYRPAGADDSDTVAGFIMRNAGDIALGAEEERELIESDWESR